MNFPVAPWRGYNENRTFNIRDAYVNNPSYHAVQENDSENFYQRVNIMENWFAGEGFVYGSAFKEE